MSVSANPKPSLCRCCGLTKGTSKVVIARGSPLARLMLIGEAPGAFEESIGSPFVGRSGKLLDQILAYVGIDPKRQIYICNVIKSRPPANRRPLKSEITSALPWLHQQIKLVDPWIIILAGSTAVNALLGIKKGISSLRGKWHAGDGRLFIPIFHPAYLLRNSSKKKGSPYDLTLADFRNVTNVLNRIETNGSMPLVLPEHKSLL